jgi:hypothetical protein
MVTFAPPGQVELVPSSTALIGARGGMSNVTIGLDLQGVAQRYGRAPEGWAVRFGLEGEVGGAEP